jgi:NADH:ubiquinone oxidoreductase subunit 3 (subunit A)
MMPSADTGLLLLFLLQPLLVGLAVVAVGLFRLAVWGLGVLQGGARQRGRGVRFFECGAVPRLIGSLRYSAPVLTFCALFLIYDIDLLFFLTEVGPFEQGT